MKVTGIDDSRKFTVSIANVDPATPWSGTVTLQRSVSEPGAWTDVKTWTGETSETYDDGLTIILSTIGSVSRRATGKPVPAPYRSRLSILAAA